WANRPTCPPPCRRRSARPSVSALRLKWRPSSSVWLGLAMGGGRGL
ncbi:MAG: hypothetical protein AVDCRST_MAG88-53, partial [uncultured Thermomicrobiales bacterium]